MTVTSVVSFASCCDAWLSSLILITVYLAVKGQLLFVFFCIFFFLVVLNFILTSIGVDVLKCQRWTVLQYFNSQVSVLYHNVFIVLQIIKRILFFYYTKFH